VRRHVSADTLALHSEGLLSRRKSARVAAHLSRCASCAKIDSDLAAVSSALAELPRPSIPDHLAARVAMAIAAEAASRAGVSSYQAAAGTGASDGRDSGLATPPTRTHRSERPAGSLKLRAPRLATPFALRLAAAAAAVVIVTGGGYLIASYIGSSAPGTANSAPAAGGARPSAMRGAAQQGGAFTLPYGQDGAMRSTQVVTSPLNFGRAGLVHEIRREVLKSHALRSATTARPLPASSPARAAGGTNTLNLQDCVSLVAAGRDVLLVELARYRGTPATVIVTARSADSHTLDVTVVARTCSAAHADVITRLTIPAG